MNPWNLLDTANIPGGGEMKLYRRADEYSISVNREELMNSRLHGSEETLAELACQRIAERPAPRILIGGLGMGFTLAAALKNLSDQAEIVVAELVPAVIEWNHTHLADLAGRPMNDPRVTVRETDVGLVIKEQADAYDAILLDVDNGPDGLTHADNDRLYTHGGLAAAKAALKYGGILAVWSADPDTAFLKRLQGTGFKVKEHTVPARIKRGRHRHTIWLAEK